MDAQSSSYSGTSSRSFLGALLIFTIILALVLLLAWRFSPRPLIFSEDFDHAERNQQYASCKFFTIEQSRLRITPPQSYCGCAVQLPNEYDEYTFTASVYPVGEVHDGSVNLLFGGDNNIWYEIQFRPNVKQLNFIETIKNPGQDPHINFITGWVETPGSTFNHAENKLRLTVTKHAIDFSFNEVPIFLNTTGGEFSLPGGTISIGVGAGEVAGIAFEFDKIEIRSERLYWRWKHEWLAIDEIRKWAE